jgi:hypothetical protein
MVRGPIIRVLIALAFLTGAKSVLADAINFTGFVNNDFNPATHPGTYIIPGFPQSYVAQPAWMTQQGWVTGWNIQDIALNYNKATDTLYVGVQMYNNTPAGNVDGNGKPGQPDPRLVAQGGSDPAHVGGLGSITIGIDTNNGGHATVVAGIPEFKYPAGVATGLDGFAVALRNPDSAPYGSMQAQYGQILYNNMGNLAFDPSAQHPGFEFTIKNFSQLPGLNLAKGFGISAYAGSPNDVVEGKDYIPEVHIASITGPQAQTIPEPATMLGWSIVAAAGYWRASRRRRRTDA